MEKRKIPGYIKPAGYIRNGGSFILDFLFAGLLGLILYASFGRPVVYDQWMAGPEHYKAYENLALEAGIAYLDSNNTAQDYAPDSTKTGLSYYLQYEEVEAKVWNYYFNVLPNNSSFSFLNSDEFSSAAEKGSLAYQIDLGKWIYSNKFYVGTETNRYWAAPTTEDEYLVMPSLNQETYDIIYRTSPSTGEDEAIAKAKDVFETLYVQSSSSTAAYQKVLTHFQEQTSVISERSAYSAANFGAFWPSLIVAPLLFLIVIPFFSKDGKTLGKRITKVAILGADGYTAPKWRILVRSFIVSLPILLCLIPHPLIFVPLASLFYVVDFMVLVLHKNHQSIHDLLVGTIVVKSDLSLWFASKEQEERYIESHPDSLPAKFKAQQNGEIKENGRKLVLSQTEQADESPYFDINDIQKARDEAGIALGKEESSTDEPKK